MSKLTRVFLLCAIFATFLDINSPGFLVEAAKQPIYTTQAEYNFELDTDADFAKYRLLNGKLVQEGDISLNNPNGKRLQHYLKLKLPELGEYSLELTLRDAVYNTAQFSHKIIRQSSTQQNEPVDTGSFGADRNAPYGRNNDFKNLPVEAELAINSKSLGGGYKWEKFSLPQPVVTYIDNTSSGLSIFGVAPSKATQLRVSIIKNYPSYISAEKYCTGSIVVGVFRITNESHRNCMAVELGLSSLSDFYNYIDKRCGGNIFTAFNCKRTVMTENSSRQVGYLTEKLAHIRLGLVKSTELTFLWQSEKVEFRFAAIMKDLPVGQNFKITASVFGKLDFEGQAYSYDYQNSPSQWYKIPTVSNTGLNSNCKGQACKLLDIEYINQAVNEKGVWEYWPGWQKLAGGQSCGATSAVMVNDFFNNLNAKLRLKTFVFSDNNQNLKGKRCNKPGAFAVTSADASCNQSSLGGLQTYLQQYGLKLKVTWPSKSEGHKLNVATVKEAILRGNPVILSYKKPIGHILVVKGFTYGGQLVVNDPYRDIQNNYQKGKYDYSGKDAIYSLYPNSQFAVNYLIEVYK